jgi:hypothetical protein
MKQVAWVAVAASLSFPARALDFVVQDPCSATAWLQTTIDFEAAKNVGELSIEALKAHAIPFVGTAAGINAIRGTVVSDQALEIISDSRMRAYGWCYLLNGVVPDVLPDAVSPRSAQDRIEWFFAYATYDGGVWTDYCTPTHLSRPAFICGGDGAGGAL